MSSKPVYDTGVYINADVEFGTVLSLVFSFDSDVISYAAVIGMET